MVKAYFFDWMGTLGEITGRVTVKEKFGREYHNKLLLNKFEDAHIAEDCREEIRPMLQEAIHWLYPESQRSISELKPNYKLGIDSNIYDITAQRVREIFPTFLKNFDVITFSSDIGLKKPEPEIFLYTLGILNQNCKLNILPEEVIMVGDSKDKDVDPALELGMSAILINRENGNNLEDVVIK